MKYQELLEICKEHFGESVDQFAYHDFGAPDDFKASSAVQVGFDTKNDAWEKYYNSYQNGGKGGDYEALRAEYDALPSFTEKRNDEYLTSLKLGPIEEVEKHGGEDAGSDWYSIKHFPKYRIYMKVSGWYQSHHGTDFEDWDEACSEVKPRKKTITVYE